MKYLELKARAKINLSLDVIRRRPDGYHDVKMIMQTIKLHDRVYLKAIDNGIEVSCNSRWVPSNNDNIAYKAADLILSKFNIKSGIKIEIDKIIPVAAGLAGGSSDAAAVLKGMNDIFDLNISEAELMLLGKNIGADVPYCIKGGTMLAEGIGEVLTELCPMPVTDIVLVKPPIGISTAWVYKSLNFDKITKRPHTDLLIKAISNKDIGFLSKNMANVLETVTIEKYDIINEIKDRLISLGAAGSMMSGSGPTVFGIFEDRKSAEYAYETLKNQKLNCFITETVQ